MMMSADHERSHVNNSEIVERSNKENTEVEDQNELDNFISAYKFTAHMPN